MKARIIMKSVNLQILHGSVRPRANLAPPHDSRQGTLQESLAYWKGQKRWVAPQKKPKDWLLCYVFKTKFFTNFIRWLKAKQYRGLRISLQGFTDILLKGKYHERVTGDTHSQRSYASGLSQNA